MSTKPDSTTTEENTDENDEKDELRDEVELEFYAEKALAELDGHFQEHSRYFISTSGEQVLALIPEDRENTSVLLHNRTTREMLHDLGFEEATVFQTHRGAGVTFRFNLNRD